jgi:hypothetical protein
VYLEVQEGDVGGVRTEVDVGGVEEDGVLKVGVDDPAKLFFDDCPSSVTMWVSAASDTPSEDIIPFMALIVATADVGG